ncbi:hypothetical protein Phab24_id128 [Acinetobacter phage Phab24]|nr:hypothetical protein Phab24_id128 [Acinetobacter phage Phab24]
MFYIFMLYLFVGVILATLTVKNAEDNKEAFREFVGDDETVDHYFKFKGFYFSVLVFITPIWVMFKLTKSLVVWIYSLIFKRGNK